jgi:hypothetical protein
MLSKVILWSWWVNGKMNLKICHYTMKVDPCQSWGCTQSCWFLSFGITFSSSSEYNLESHKSHYWPPINIGSKRTMLGNNHRWTAAGTPLIRTSPFLEYAHCLQRARACNKILNKIHSFLEYAHCLQRARACNKILNKIHSAGVTQPPCLHQFRLGWTSVHPSYWTSRSHKGWVKKVFRSPPNSQFVFHLVLPLLTQLPHLPTYPTDFAMAKPISLLN